MGYLSDAMDKADRGDAPNQRPLGNTETPQSAPSQTGSPAPADPFRAQEQAALAATGSAAGGLNPPAYNNASAQAGGGMPASGSGAAESIATPSFHQTDLSCVDDRVLALTDATSVMSEEYRSIRTSILARWQNRRHLVHTITSGTPQEGKTITSLNLGFCFAEMRNRKVIVIEADLRLPQFSKLLNLPKSPGLTDVLEEKADLSEGIHTAGDSALHILPAGHRAHDQAVQLLSSPVCSNLIARLRRTYDHVIIDTPPVVELADAGILGAMSDEVLLIVRMERTPKPLFQQAVRILQSYNAPVAGIIATDHHHYGGRYYYYKYGYRYRYRYHDKKAA